MRTKIPNLIPAMAAALLVGACAYPEVSSEQTPAATVSQTTPTPTPGAEFSFSEGQGKTPIRFPDGLQMIDLQTGNGPIVPAGSTVEVLYAGWLSNGTEFDASSQHGNQPLCAILQPGASSNGNCTGVIQGWVEGIPGMHVGGRRKLIIPPALGYGAQGSPPTIPANATLIFIVQVTGIVSTPTPTP
ncbi:MAG TPA: FKBP-type peptidyl-prolyl cis-trans isomerase [Candidatus Dormibacteraeota bacterium]|nr:FKBP-type peptidyl-prolyl cis-trans isomerase [Candidatus Dormibacteraeota bacterium]